MFDSPLTITVNGTDHDLEKINQDAYSSEYLLRLSGSQYQLFIRNTRVKDKSRGNAVIEQHNVELIHTVFPVDPNQYATIRRAYFVLRGDQSDTLLDPQYVGSALVDFLDVSGVMAKLMGFAS